MLPLAKMKTVSLSSTQLSQAKQLLKSGEVIGLPTETVYGLAADAANPKAIEKIFKIKQRPTNNPLIVHIANLTQLNNIAQNIPDYALKLAKAFWPGPLTLVLAKQNKINNIITAGQATVAVRMPNHPLALDLIQEFDLGLVAPSANIYTKISPTTKAHVIKGLNGKISAVLDGGECSVGIESTIIDCTTFEPIILRAGMITEQDINAVLVDQIIPSNKNKKSKIKAPGQHKVHYSPTKPLILLNKNDLQLKIAEFAKNKIPFAGFGFNQEQAENWIIMTNDPISYAQKLYNILHDLDALNIDFILAQLPPQDATWAAINDRLSRASHKQELI